jgi:hypothetical protein
MFLCERCGEATNGVNNNRICYKCYKSIFGKYTRDGQVVDKNVMDQIEEYEQICDFYLKKTNNTSERGKR